MGMSQVETQTRITVLPKPVEDRLIRVRDRIKELKKKYGSLAKYGYPILENEDEVIALIYAVKFAGMSEHELANTFGIEKMTVYRWVKSYEQKGCLRIYKEGKVQEFCISPEEVKRIVEEEWLKPSRKKYIKEIYECVCVQEFLKNPRKRALTAPELHGEFYSQKEIKNILARLAKVVAYINEHRDEFPNLPSNPDEWTKEHEGDLLAVIVKVASMSLRKSKDVQALRRLVRQYLISLRALPCLAEKRMFEGKVGASVRFAKPIEETLFLEHYYKLKEILWIKGSNEDRALFLIIYIHIWTGAREGWTHDCIANIKGRNPDELKNADLDDPDIQIGLVGLKWSKAIFEKGKLMGFRIFESKTASEWILKYRWLDPEMVDFLEKVYEFAKKHNIDSVVKSILLYFGVKPKNGNGWTLKSFKEWYTKQVKRIPKLLGENWENFTPHRLRSAHISILAELRIPLEIVLSNVGFGSGWFDLNTARVYYLRFSESLISEYLQKALEIQSKFASKTA
jgi:Transposase and inactivated derivatives